MVTPALRPVGASLLWFVLPGLLGAAGKTSPLAEMDGTTRGRIVLALAGLILLWIAVIALVWLGARVVRRRAAGRLVQQKQVGPWYEKPVVPVDDDPHQSQPDA